MDAPRFLTPADAADVLATSVAQIMALIRAGDLRAIQIGGRGQWRVEVAELEAYIQRQYSSYDARHSASSTANAGQGGEAD